MSGEGSSFALTLDLGERLGEFRRVGIDAPGPHDQYVSDIQQELTTTLANALPGISVVPVHVTDVSDEIIGKVSALPAVRSGDATVVSTCPEIAYPTGGEELQINRLVSFDGEDLGIGPRPGNDFVDDQIRRIRAKTHKDGVILVEDGVFSGSTVRYIEQKMREFRVPIRGIVVGLNCSDTFEAEMEQQGYDFFTTIQAEQYADWVPDHDFMPFIPGSGRIVGVKVSEKTGAAPLYHYRDGASFSVPYVHPFGPMEQWASVPAENVSKVATACINLTQKLFLDIERRNGSKDLRIGDFLETNRMRIRSSIPARLGHPSYPDVNAQVSKYLNEIV